MNDGETFIDGVYQCILQIDQEKACAAISALHNEGYDTDALEMDLSSHSKNGNCNLFQLVQHRVIFAAISDYVDDLRCMSYI